MARKKNSEPTEPKDQSSQQDTDLQEIEKEILMRSAMIKGTDCHYSFEALKSNSDKGYHAGTVYPVKPKNTIIKDTLSDAMAKGNVHLACLDDAFLLSDIDFDNLALVSQEEIVEDYNVEGIALKGNEGDFKVIITGKKFSRTAKERINLEVQVALAEHGTYVHRELLQAWVDEVMKEAELYMHGNYDLAEEDELEDPKQTKIQFEQPQAAVDEEGNLSMGSDGDFDNDKDSPI